MRMSKRNNLIGYLAAAIFTVLCSAAAVYGIKPFGAAAYVAAACGGFFTVAPIYIVAEFLFSFELAAVYSSGAVLFIMAIRYVLGLRFCAFAKPRLKTVFAVAALAAKSGVTAFFEPPITCAIEFFTGLAFLFFVVSFVGIIKGRYAFKPTVTELSAVFVAAAVSGLALGGADVNVEGLRIGLAAAYFFALLACDIKCAFTPIVSGLSLGLALSLSPAYAVAFATSAVCAKAFVSLPRPLYALTGLGVFAAAAVLLYLSAAELGYAAAMLAVGGLLHTVIPPKKIRVLREYFDFDSSARVALRHYINRVKADAGNRMLTVSCAFDELARLFNAAPEVKPDHRAAALMLADKICPYCQKRAECDSAAAERAFLELAQKAYDGKVIITDLPEFFTKTCRRPAEALHLCGDITERAKKLRLETECELKAKAIVTEQLNAVKSALNELGQKQAVPIGFDDVTGKAVIFELNERGIECADAFVTAEGVTAIVRSGADSRTIAKAVSRCLRREFGADIEKSRTQGWSVATCKALPLYDAVYARAGLSKDGGVSGDGYAFERIGDKFIVALCDGMGSGEAAGFGADLALELIENFYRAGFDSTAVLSSVNRFLKLPGSERYSAADVCVIDLVSGVVDIIKIGAPPCYIKTADTVLTIEGESLPIGVLDEMRPYCVKKVLTKSQMLFLVSDGVSDCFDGDELAEYINGLSALNPETAAKNVLSRAAAFGAGKDDMTVIAVRLSAAQKRFNQNRLTITPKCNIIDT